MPSCRNQTTGSARRPATNGVEAARPPLKTYKPEVSPLPRKTQAVLSAISAKCHRAPKSQVLIRPAKKWVEAAPLPLKRNRAPTNERTHSLGNTLSSTCHSKSSTCYTLSYTSHTLSYTTKKLSENNPNFHRSDQSLKNSKEYVERFVIPSKSNENALNTLNVCFDSPQKAVLKGSFDQADARFGDSHNRQCGAIGLTAVLKSKLKNVLTWSTQDLDGVLVAGTCLYETRVT